MLVSRPVRQILSRLQTFREEAGLTSTELEERLILGPGWIPRFERGEMVPSLDVLLAILGAVGKTPNQLFNDISPETAPGAVERVIFADEEHDDLLVHFKYADFDASYVLRNASLKEFEDVLRILRNGLAGGGQKSDAIVDAFQKAVDQWPDANPSDLWWFLIHRAYLDPFNHPSSEARRDLPQGWKRAGGWALERVLVAHYGPFLEQHGVSLAIPKGEEKTRLLDQLHIPNRLEVDKVDVVLSAAQSGAPRCFGVVHVKASFAERRTDDVELSKALVDAGYCSPFWTMDCKSTPSATPTNRGELGSLLEDAEDLRSAKRKDFEVDGFFSACFSYNSRTRPTPEHQRGVAARVYVCDFANPDDNFSRFILAEWERFKRREPTGSS